MLSIRQYEFYMILNQDFLFDLKNVKAIEYDPEVVVV